MIKSTRYLLLVHIGIAALGCSGCLKQTSGSREIEQLRSELQSTNLVATAERLRPLVSEITAEAGVHRMALSADSPQYFRLVTSTNTLKAYVGEHDRLFDGNTAQWSESEKQLAERWLSKMRSFQLFGFSAFSKTNEVRIYFKPNAYLLYLAPTVSASWRSEVERLVKVGHDGRGDVFFRVSTNVMAASERR